MSTVQKDGSGSLRTSPLIVRVHLQDGDGTPPYVDEKQQRQLLLLGARRPYPGGILPYAMHLVNSVPSQSWS